VGRVLFRLGQAGGEAQEPEPLLDDEPDGGAPGAPSGWDPLPMLGQLCDEPDPVLAEPEFGFEFVFELDPVLDPVLELDPELPDVVLVLVDPVSPVLELVEPADPVPELPVVDVVAALATSAPPVTSPADKAPMASTLRRRIFIGFSFLSCASPARSTRHHPR
jgi:hypothetical protein